jgi:gas vesicle structural protein
MTDDLALQEELQLVELVNRVLDRGVVVGGDVIISVAGVDLLYVGLRVLLSSVETMREKGLTDLGGARRWG